MRRPKAPGHSALGECTEQLQWPYILEISSSAARLQLIGTWASGISTATTSILSWPSNFLHVDIAAGSSTSMAYPGPSHTNPGVHSAKPDTARTQRHPEPVSSIRAMPLSWLSVHAASRPTRLLLPIAIEPFLRQAVCPCILGSADSPKTRSRHSAPSLPFVSPWCYGRPGMPARSRAWIKPRKACQVR